MKTASSTLIANLANNAEFYRADLWTIVLLNGYGTLQYTSWPNQITTTDARTFLPGPPNFVRNRLTSEIGVKVTTLNLELHASDTNTMPDGTPLIRFIAGGGFTGATLTLETAIMLNPGDTSAGTVVEFVGEVGGADSIGRSSAKFTVNALTNRLNQQVPRNVIQPSCPFTLFDSACTLNQASFAVNCTVLSGSTANQINASHGKAASYFALGKIQFTSGLMNGHWFSIRDNTTSALSPVKNMGFTPTAGDTFTAYPGCDKLQTTCNTKFSNLVHFGGFPFVPEPEAGI
ncbi:MAG TPA: DUF2163 domain-containing protein [Terriglobales bacterium]|nr:DUF2163 domain-containing protein [Terriglobales bacterium]